MLMPNRSGQCETGLRQGQISELTAENSAVALKSLIYLLKTATSEVRPYGPRSGSDGKSAQQAEFAQLLPKFGVSLPIISNRLKAVVGGRLDIRCQIINE